MRYRFSFGSITASLFVGGLIALSVTGNTGCSVIFKDSAEQCSTDGDCRARGLVGAICSDQVCIAGCTSADQCTSEAGGRAAICGSNNKCTVLEIDGCTLPRDQGVLVPTYKDPNAIFIGELSATTSTQIPGAGAHNQLVMANDDLRTVQAPGVPGGPGGVRRPLVPISCETGDDAAKMTAYAKHFVDVVNAPIIVSTWNPHAIRVHAAVTASQKSVFEYCVTCSADIRRFAAGSGDVSTIYSGTAAAVDLAAGIAAKASELETDVRATPGFSGNVRLALLITSGLEGAPPDQTADEVLKTLRFNGKSAADNGDDYRFFSYVASDSRDAIAEQVAAFAPHIIIPITLAEANQSLFPLIEGKWRGSIRPRYVGNVGQQQSSMLTFVQGNDERRKRVVIVNQTPTPTDAAKFNAWSALYSQRFGTNSGPSIAYDAYYALAYSIVAAGAPASGKLTGTDLVRGLLNLKGGSSSYFVGNGDLVVGMAAALQGKIDLSGYVLPLNFSPDTGRIPLSRIPIFCIGRQQAGAPPAFLPSGQEFNVATQQLQGKYNCPGD
ncbi:hypothetical protein LZC95_20950 [Pendulispora brunnea]|uniref:Uncharacterized protein n=1 Tax=Pendulispora brunnea TaxID=2905690 RepID=A0ABZ2KPN2_9BACT